MKTLRFSMAAVIAAATLVACGGDDEAASADAPVSSSASQLLEYVPGDSPYVLAALAPSPAKVQEKFEPMYEMAIRQYHDMFVGARMAMVEGSDGEAPEELVGLMDVLIAETSDGDLGGIGFDPESDIAIVYGNGLLPVLRMSVSDESAWDAFYTKIIGEAGVTPETKTIDGIEIDLFGGDAPVQAFVAQSDGMLTLSVAPTGIDDAAIGQLMGASKPATSMLESGTLAAIADEYGFVPQTQGYFDFQQVFNMATSSGNALNDSLFATTPTLPMELDAACQAEMSGLAAVMPRMVLGVTRLDTDGMDSIAVVEMRDDAASALKPITGIMPGLTASTDSALKFGVAISLQGLRDWVESTMGGIVESPFECAQLDGLNVMSVQATEALQQPLPPIVYNLKGYSFEMSSLEGLEGLGMGQMPENLEMDIALGFENVQGLLMMGQMFVPQLAEMALEPNGEAVPLPEQVGGQPIPVSGFMAMADDMLAISLGDGGESRAEANAAATAEGEKPLLSHFDMDAGAYFAFIADIMETTTAGILADDSLPQEQREMMEQQQANMQAMAEGYEALFDRMTLSVTVTDRGIEIPSTASFK